MLGAGAVVDRYEVLGLLGEGGMARVYVVRHRHLGTEHVLKVLAAPGLAGQARLLREGQVQAALRHPHVLPVTDVIDVAGAPGLVMPRVIGPSLDRALALGRLPAPAVDALAEGLFAGLGAAHAAGLVHRDLKPANVLLDLDDVAAVPKIADFGLVKRLERTWGEAQTATGATMGTPLYMAPEQIRGTRDVDQRADLWALGAILYEMLTGLRAFPGDNLLAVFSAVDKVAYRPLRELAPDAPDRMVSAIEAALSRKAADRPASVKDLFVAWAGETMPTMSSSIGPWDASALAMARSTTMSQPPQSSAPTTTSQPKPALSGSLARSDSAVRGVTLIGIGTVGLAGVGAALLAVLGVGGVALWWNWSSAPAVAVPPPVAAEQAPVDGAEVPEAPLDGEAPVDPLAVPAPATAPGKPGTPAPGAPAPGSPAPGSPAPGSPAPVGDLPAPADDPAVAEVDPAQPEPTPPGPADLPPPAPASSEAETDLGLLDSPDPDERKASIRRQMSQPDEDTSRRLLALIRKEPDASVRTLALDSILALWDQRAGHWESNRDAAIYAMSLGERDALKGVTAYGRHGRTSASLLPALRHTSPAVRKAALDVVGTVAKRGDDGDQVRAAVEVLRADKDPAVAKAAERAVQLL